MQYGGDGNFLASTSAVLNQFVNADATTTALKSSKNPTVHGQSVTFTATVKAASPGSGTPTGKVTFLDGGNPIGTATLNGSGVATLATSSLFDRLALHHGDLRGRHQLPDEHVSGVDADG